MEDGVKKTLFAVVLSVGMMLIGCNVTQSGRQKNEIARWRQNIVALRAETDKELKTDKTSPMAGVARLQVKADEGHYLDIADKNVMVSPKESAQSWLEFHHYEEGWTWKSLQSEIMVSLDGKPYTKNAVEAELVFRMGRFTLQAYPSADTVTLLVFDAERPELKKFAHLLYFDPNPDLAVEARVERLKSPEQVTMLTSRNLEKTYYRYAVLHFEIDGKQCQLAAYKMNLKGPYDDTLFIPFRDATSGKETYGAGRFLELKEKKGATMLLDFNLAFNPLCNYSPAYNCPIPPAENTLSIQIRAGEKAYPHYAEDRH